MPARPDTSGPRRPRPRAAPLLAVGIGCLAAAAAGAQAPHFDPAAATAAWLAKVDGAARARSDAYFEGTYWLILWNALVGAGIAWATLRLGVARRLSTWARRVARGRRILAVPLFAMPYTLLVGIAGLPWTIYSDWWRERQYGLSNQTLAAFLGDQAKAAPIGVVTMALLLMAVLPLYWRRPRSWWAWGTAICAAFLAIGMVVGPVLIEPMFNRYTPMAPGPLRDQILSMARANGVPAGNVYVVDASRQTDRVSANVAGLGPTIRVALNDNLLRRARPNMVRSVMGHELGHYVLGHTPSLLVAFTLVALGCLLAIDRGVPALARRFGARWGVGLEDDPAVFAIASIVIALLALPLTPIVNNIVRFHERQADYFGINVSRAPDGFAATALLLGQYRKLDPSPLEEFLLYDHPSGHSRIAMAMQWKAEHLGEPGVE